MLCQFTVKNYKSIRDEETFDMQAAAISEHEDSVIRDRDNEVYLPVSAIYGPNGGGKSNVLAALYTLVTKILRPLYATEDNDDRVITQKRVVIEPFAFSDSKLKPTEFELFFRTESSEYRYILHIKRDVVVYESLDKVKLQTGRRSALYARDENGVTLKGVFSKFKVSDDLSKTLALLSYFAIAYKENVIVKEVISWFESGVLFLNYGNPIQELRMAISTSREAKQVVLDMIQEMDLDIIDFRVEEKENHTIDVFTKHCVEGKETELSLSDESSGTRKLFGLLPFIAESLLKGTVLVVDELDAKIHPILLRHIITMFTDKNINRHRAQLIFTSHDLSTMNNEVFRRDEIWFVAKGNEENTQLYSLVEFRNEKGEAIRKDAKYDKQYLEGRYGADPYLRRIIDWGKVNA